MSTISELRARAERSKRLQQGNIDEFSKAIDSSNIDHKVNAVSNKISEFDRDENEIATQKENNKERVQSSDPVSEFRQKCKDFGLSEVKIKHAVEFISKKYELESDIPYEIKLEIVAMYVNKHPNVYNDLTEVK